MLLPRLARAAQLNHDIETRSTDRMLRFLIVFIFLLISPLHAQELGNRLSLICSGGGAARREFSAVAHGWDNSGHRANAVVLQQGSEGFEDQIQLWVEGDHGSIRLPRTMLPNLHGGKNGWFDLRDVAIAQNEITGSAAINALNHPKVILDRVSGTVTISGKSGQFNGRCIKIDPSSTQHAF